MHPQRRRKKQMSRVLKGKEFRTVEIIRNSNEQSFGFTVSGQIPCILKEVKKGSPADVSGLRNGDFLISVNGLNVSKYPHETVVQMIAKSIGKIKMTIAENYYSDSSDEDVYFQQSQPRIRPKHRGRDKFQLPEAPIYAHSESHNVIHSPNASINSDISNVSAMVRCSNVSNPQNMSKYEYRVFVGYLGTIEIPKEIVTSSKLQTVRSCIRKIRQEKRNPTLVLMKIKFECLNLFDSTSRLLATYPSSRLNFVSSSSDSNSKFFGIVTSAIYADGMPCDSHSFDSLSTRKDIIISNSCHVFAIDTKLIDHNVHVQKSDKFKISCTIDPISNCCLEFPNNSEYIVNLVRSMYSLKGPTADSRLRSREDHHDLMLANSPQPSNHSLSSNSDSGIGFHNEYANLADRILVVDFPRLNQSRRMAMRRNLFQRAAPRPFGIINDIQLENISPVSHRNKLTVRAMPDPIVSLPDPIDNWLPGKAMDPIVGDLVEERPIDVPGSDSFGISDAFNYRSYRSCDDMMMIMEKEHHFGKPGASIDDICLISNKDKIDDHIFLAPPSRAIKKTNLPINKKLNKPGNESEKLMSYKLSPKVFLSMNKKKNATKSNDKNKNIEKEDFTIWGSLVELSHSEVLSEPDLRRRSIDEVSFWHILL